MRKILFLLLTLLLVSCNDSTSSLQYEKTPVFCELQRNPDGGYSSGWYIYYWNFYVEADGEFGKLEDGDYVVHIEARFKKGDILLERSPAIQYTKTGNKFTRESVLSQRPVPDERERLDAANGEVFSECTAYFITPTHPDK